MEKIPWFPKTKSGRLQAAKARKRAKRRYPMPGKKRQAWVPSGTASRRACYNVPE